MLFVPGQSTTTKHIWCGIVCLQAKKIVRVNEPFVVRANAVSSSHVVAGSHGDRKLLECQFRQVESMTKKGGLSRPHRESMTRFCERRTGFRYRTRPNVISSPMVRLELWNQHEVVWFLLALMLLWLIASENWLLEQLSLMKIKMMKWDSQSSACDASLKVALSVSFTFNGVWTWRVSQKVIRRKVEHKLRDMQPKRADVGRPRWWPRFVRQIG